MKSAPADKAGNIGSPFSSSQDDFVIFELLILQLTCTVKVCCLATNG
jgi:hypothetical protein